MIPVKEIREDKCLQRYFSIYRQFTYNLFIYYYLSHSHFCFIILIDIVITPPRVFNYLILEFLIKFLHRKKKKKLSIHATRVYFSKMKERTPPRRYNISPQILRDSYRNLTVHWSCKPRVDSLSALIRDVVGQISTGCSLSRVCCSVQTC